MTAYDISSAHVWVHGATGHTGRFVVDELMRRGVAPVLAGRDASRLAAEGVRHPHLERVAIGLDDPRALSAALEGVDVVLNCAGPFLDTAARLSRAAVSVGAHYLDLAAEQGAVQGLYHDLDGPATAAGVAVVPAMAFFGGLADLLVTTLIDAPASAVDEIVVATWLDHWWPTEGTRATGRRNTLRRLVIRGGELAPLEDPAPVRSWDFPRPVGTHAVTAVPLTEIITVARHVRVRAMESFLASAALADLADASVPAPAAADESGRSVQRFVVDVTVRQGGRTLRAAASGRDIYAVSAPIIVEGALRLAAGGTRSGALAPGQAFDAHSLLTALSDAGHLVVG